MKHLNFLFVCFFVFSTFFFFVIFFSYVESAGMYEQLVKLFPGDEQYGLYYAQALYKAGMYQECLRACAQVRS